MKHSLTLAQVLALLRKRQGDRSVRAFAGELGVSHVYLLHIYSGKREPGPVVLEQLGITREVTYHV